MRTFRFHDPYLPEVNYRIPVSGNRQVGRFRSIAVKEPGTNAWLNRCVGDGDVFYDIGANVGIYSLMAAARIGDGKVYAFEPHAPNYTSLLHAIVLNGLEGKVVPFSSALSNAPGFAPFHYGSLEAGTSGVHLQGSVNLDSAKVTLSELKATATLDSLVFDYGFHSPTLVKIDVDGLESLVVEGMTKILTDAAKPRSVQIEADPKEREKIVETMESFGYRISSTNYTEYGMKRIKKGLDPDDYPYNIVFEPICSITSESGA